MKGLLWLSFTAYPRDACLLSWMALVTPYYNMHVGLLMFGVFAYTYASKKGPPTRPPTALEVWRENDMRRCSINFEGGDDASQQTGR